MAGFSDTMETELLNYILRGTALTTLSAAGTPGSLYWALWVGDPLDDGSGGAEAAYTGYARQPTTRASGTWAAPANSAGAMLSDNVAAITFPASSAGSSAVTHVVCMSAITGGTQIFNQALTTPQTITAGGSAPVFAIGALDVTLT